MRVGLDMSLTGAASGIAANPAEILLRADLINGSYMFDGASVTFAEMFDDPSSDNPTAGVGLQVTKALATGATAFGKTMYFAESVFDRLNVAGGFTVVVEEMFDNMAQGPVAHPNANTTFHMGGPDAFKLIKYAKWDYHGVPVVPDHGSGFGLQVETVEFDYDFDLDNVPGFDGPALTLGEAHEAYFSANRALHAYFADDPSIVATAGNYEAADIPLPEAGFTQVWVGIGASAHEGTAGDKDAVSSRSTLSRLRIYTPAQPVGWVAPIEPLMLSDFKNEDYQLFGVPVALADLWENSDAYWVGSLPTVTAGVGAIWTGTQNTRRAGKIKAAVKAVMPLAQGFTVVADVVFSRTGTLRPRFAVTAHDAPGFIDVIELLDDAHFDQVQLSTFDSASAVDGVVTLDGAMHRIAATFGPDGFDLSVDGRSVQSDAMDATSMVGLLNLAFALDVRNTAGTGTATITCERMAFYRPQFAASLPSLSAL